jgi:predicted nucleic acid-binding Zn ribbon protein
VPHAKGWSGRRDPRSADSTAIGEVVDGLLSEDLFARGLPIGRLAAMWPEVVGARLAAETAPASLEGRVLTVEATNGPWGAQARFLNEEIRRHADDALGGGRIDRVHVVVKPR